MAARQAAAAPALTAAAPDITSRSRPRSPTPRSCRTRSSAAQRRCPPQRPCVCNNEMNAMQLPLMHQISERLRVIAGDMRAYNADEFALAAPAVFIYVFGILVFV